MLRRIEIITETGDRELEGLRRFAKMLGELTQTRCKHCGSMLVVKNGRRRGTQYWLCKSCGRGFVDNQALPKMKYPIDIIADAVYDYYAGNSLNKIAEGIKHKAQVKPSTSSVYGWIQRLTNAGLEEAKKHQPQVGRKWVMDETVITLNGRKYWYIIAIDADTRFILGTKVSRNRNKKDIQYVLEKATAKTKRIPAVVLSDGWVGYIDAIELAYGSESKHIISKPFESNKELSTNLIERFNGTLKDRLKTMRGMDRNENVQLILEGFVFYYNYLRPHMGIDGKTPAEVAKVDYPHKSWQDIAQSLSPVKHLLQPEPASMPDELKDLIIRRAQRTGYRKRSKPSKKRPRMKPKTRRANIAPTLSVTRF